MGLKNPKAKGSSFERDTARELSLWLSKGERPDLLRRTVLSGGQFTNFAKRAKYGKSLGEAGDLGPNHPDAQVLTDKVVIECKHWKVVDFYQVLWRKGLLYDALMKVKGEGGSIGKSWVLIARQNNRPTLIFFPVPVFIDAPRPAGGLFIRPVGRIPAFPHHKVFNGKIYLAHFDDFLTMSPELFINTYAANSIGIGF